MIRFVIKSIFWLALAFIVMPRLLSSENESVQNSQPESFISAADRQSVDAILQGGKSAVEIGKFCIDNPKLCENGATILSSSSGGIMDYFSKSFLRNSEAIETAPIKPITPVYTIPLPISREQALKDMTIR